MHNKNLEKNKDHQELIVLLEIHVDLIIILKKCLPINQVFTVNSLKET